MSQISRICPVTDAEAERIVRPATFADLGGRITASPAATADGTPGRPYPAAGSRARRRWLIGAPLAAGLAVVVLLVTWLASPAQRVGPVRVGPQVAQALSFTTSGRYITVIVRNPLADPTRYRAEFAAHHLDITLTLVPAGFRGQAQLAFGRAARPGERYETTAPATAPGEVMHGMRFQGDTVSQVLAMLRERDVTVPVFNYARQGYARNLSHVPGSWYVYDAAPWASQQVMLFVGPTKTPPAAKSPQPGTPVPSPTS
jgi:hypothetical protein